VFDPNDDGGVEFLVAFLDPSLVEDVLLERRVERLHRRVVGS